MTDCKVDIVVSYQNDILVIRVTNTVRQKPNFIVNKGEEHGLGLKIVNSIVNKYNGVIFIDYPDDKIVFNIKINV
ncbi:GHKL domain-containing protein [Coprobacillaceae bacterium CR2/5/TPMF4]|nr:GHKL domain-containing protein [Coprobacillaceae bacterium CR2/5/TPMF4]